MSLLRRRPPWCVRPKSQVGGPRQTLRTPGFGAHAKSVLQAQAVVPRRVYDKSVVARSPHERQRRRGDPCGRPHDPNAPQGARSPVCGGPANVAFARTGRHKGVPYGGSAMSGVSGHSPRICRTPSHGEARDSRIATSTVPTAATEPDAGPCPPGQGGATCRHSPPRRSPPVPSRGRPARGRCGVPKAPGGAGPRRRGTLVVARTTLVVARVWGHQCLRSRGRDATRASPTVVR